MPRRAGKAASRRARQRAGQRRAQRPRPSAPPSASAATPPAAVGTPDAREAISLDPPRRAAAAVPVRGSSQLSEHDRAEYHYVERDLRSIGIITAVMVALL